MVELQDIYQHRIVKFLINTGHIHSSGWRKHHSKNIFQLQRTVYSTCFKRVALKMKETYHKPEDIFCFDPNFIASINTVWFSFRLQQVLFLLKQVFSTSIGAGISLMIDPSIHLLLGQHMVYLFFELQPYCLRFLTWIYCHVFNVLISYLKRRRVDGLKTIVKKWMR